MAGTVVRRNASCPCGSGRRYKACCGRTGGGDPGSSWLDATMQAALAAQRDGLHEIACARYAEVLKRMPGLADALHMYGVAQYAIGDLDGALASIAEAVRRFESWFPQARVNLALVVATELARVAPARSEPQYLRYAEMRATRERAAEAPRGRVSVVVPSHGHAPYVEAALASALEQTRPADEIVVIDDGSTDGSVARIRAFAARASGRLRFVAREWRGAAATINEAIAMSSGDWIAILNSDDRYAPARIETMLARVAGAGAQWGFSRSEFIGADGAVVAPRCDGRVDGLRALQDGLGSFDSVGLAFVARNAAITTGALFVSRALFDRVGGFCDLRYTHDWEFCLRASLHEEPVYVPDRLYEYRMHGANTIAARGGGADAEADEMLREFYAGAMSATPSGNPFAPLPSVWGPLFWLRAIEGGNAALIPPGVVEALADDLLGREAA